jgi:LIVCS family branched-chain amino acid:cation transporter
MNKKFKDTLLIGAALFAMFFGAGNLIFPPSIGIASGDKWLMSLIGFILTGIGLPVLGIIAVAKAGGTINDLASRVHPLFSKILGSIVILAIGPLLAIPRTGATVFEIGIQPIWGNISPIIVSVVYFSITLFFVIKPSGIMDKIGKILTPILLVVTLSIVIKGILNPIGSPVSTNIALPFTNGFTSGYQTMDALASIVMAAIVLISLIEKGYTEKKEQISMTMKAGLIAGTGLLVIYGGLLYLGACSSGIYSSDISKSELIVNITNLVLGNLGQISMCIVVSAACLTTSIGLTAVVGNYFSELSNNKISYKSIVIFTTLFSAVMAVAGVEQIVKLAVPLLVLVYPVAMVLIVLGLFDQFIPNKNVYRGAVAGALIIGLFDGFSATNIEIQFIHSAIAKLPLASSGFAWVLPSLILGLLGSLIPQKRKKESKILHASEQLS